MQYPIDKMRYKAHSSCHSGFTAIQPTTGCNCSYLKGSSYVIKCSTKSTPVFIVTYMQGYTYIILILIIADFK